jgi:predicted deacetylase
MSRFKLAIFLCLGMYLCPNPSQAQSSTEPSDSLLFVIRVDDILSRNTTYRPSSIRPFQDMADAKGVPISWAVMPNRFLERNVNQGEMTRDLRHAAEHGHEIVLHGYTHICQQCGQSSHEMYCTTYNRPFTSQQQLKLITDGLKILSDSLNVRPTSFVPPGHVYDATTLEVLIDEGFDVITVPGEIEASPNDMLNLGTSEDFGWAITSANYNERRTQALADIRERGGQDGLYTLLLHDPFTRAGYLDGLLIQWTAEVIDSVKAEYGSNVRFVTLSQAAEAQRQTSTSIERDTEHPLSVRLDQNYPNPFNPSTQIPFSLMQTETVSLVVTDLSGRIVAQLLDGAVYPSGSHQISWNAAPLASGIYLYTLSTTSGQRLTRTLTLLK